MSEVVQVRDEDAKEEKGYGQGPPPIIEEPTFDPNGNDSNGDTGQPFGNAFIAMLLFMGADIMFFAG
ncbi:hypothetical protein GWO43_01340, partial [candidate division KSB1 bacterium]|nr:hypothetical protein [candidate division KSB1 bacterium]NIR69311.1 hypothetical protein [candidate division KSB1 bacterium]NIS22717.1 hypothetical protein [candidate division KSB1 bacterium]NIT69563.1 hypothetical protein [candidate division KSB1 bacterium]NIU23217.1 hypothetical protein [candidate division KSB1 bacterium]